MSDSALARQLAGYGLTTAEILYRMPDHLNFLQTFVWQEYDVAPEYPVLFKFLDFWECNLDGPLYSVKIAHQRLVSPGEVRLITKEIGLQ